MSAALIVGWIRRYLPCEVGAAGTSLLFCLGALEFGPADATAVFHAVTITCHEVDDRRERSSGRPSDGSAAVLLEATS